jgi:cell division protein FtsL
VIPAGECDIYIGDTGLIDALSFTPAPERLTVEIVNTSEHADEEVWVTVGYNCPLGITSPPWPPGTQGCNTDGTVNPDYAWPAEAGQSPRRFWYEVYAGQQPLPAFTGIRLTDLPTVPGRAHTYALSVANINSGVVYVAYEVRTLTDSYQQASTRRHQLQVEWGKLLLEQSALGSFSRVERVAIEKLGMRVPSADEIIMVDHAQE